MKHANGAALKTLMRFYDAETIYLQDSNRDFSVIAKTLDPDCVIYQPVSLPYGGEWRGHDGFEAWMKAFSEAWSALEVRDPEFFPAGDDMIFSRSTVEATSRTSQLKTTWPLLQQFRIRNEQILELRPFYWDTATTLKALNG